MGNEKKKRKLWRENRRSFRISWAQFAWQSVVPPVDDTPLSRRGSGSKLWPWEHPHHFTKSSSYREFSCEKALAHTRVLTLVRTWPCVRTQTHAPTPDSLPRLRRLFPLVRKESFGHWDYVAIPAPCETCFQVSYLGYPFSFLGWSCLLALAMPTWLSLQGP